MTRPLPWCFAVNDRPVQVVATADGGADVMTLDPQTGEFIRDMNQLAIYFEGGRDVDDLTKEQFDALVAKHRAWLKGD